MSRRQTRECVGGYSTCRSARANGKKAKKGKDFNFKFKVFLSSNEVKRGHTVFPPSNHLINYMRVCLCVIRSQCLSYPVLRLRVSPRSQQELYSCGVTEARGQNERSVANLTT